MKPTIGTIECSMKTESTVTIRKDEMDALFGDVGKIVTKEAMLELKQTIIDEIKHELRSLPPSKFHHLAKWTGGGNKPLREQIIDSIDQANQVDEKTIFKWEDAKWRMEIKIPHPLAYALNYGTGIHGPEGTPIVPKTKKYLFIPGLEYGKIYERKKLVAQGMTRSEAREKTRIMGVESRAKGRKSSAFRAYVKARKNG